jgi:cytochrome b
MVLVSAFVAVAVLLAVAFWLFYRSHDHSSAFWVMVAVAAVVVVHLYFVYQSAHNVALLCHVPLGALVVFLLWAYWRSYHPTPVPATA